MYTIYYCDAAGRVIVSYPLGQLPPEDPMTLGGVTQTFIADSNVRIPDYFVTVREPVALPGEKVPDGQPKFRDGQLLAGKTIAGLDPALIDLSNRHKVKLECERRLMALYGARDRAHLDVIVSNASREAVALLDKKVETGLEAAEEQRRQYLIAANGQFDLIRERSNELEENPPADVTNDVHWPPMPS